MIADVSDIDTKVKLRDCFNLPNKKIRLAPYEELYSLTPKAKKCKVRKGYSWKIEFTKGECLEYDIQPLSECSTVLMHHITYNNSSWERDCYVEYQETFNYRKFANDCIS